MGADQDPYEGVLARAAKVIEDTRQTVLWARDARQRARDAVATSHELGGSLPTADPRSHRVLVVDDDVSVRESTCDVLSYRGYEVESANDGGQALQRLARSPAIDLVVLDLRMPGIDGIGVLDALSSDPVVIILSAFEYRSQAEMRMHFSQRVCRFLPKPVPPRDLVRAVDSCLASAA